MSEQPETESLTSENQDFADEVLGLISEGHSVRSIAKSYGIPERTLRHWVSTGANCFADSARAKESGIDSLAEQCLELSDDRDLPSDHKRIMIDTRLRLLGKWSRRYADKTAHEHTGADGGPIQTETSLHLSADEAYRALLG